MLERETEPDAVTSHTQLHYELQKMYKTPYVRTSTVVIGHTRTALFSTFDVGVVGRCVL